MDKPEIIKKIDATLAASNGRAFAVRAESRAFSEAREYLQETTGEWLSEPEQGFLPLEYAGVKIYRSRTDLSFGIEGRETMTREEIDARRFAVSWLEGDPTQ